MSHEASPFFLSRLLIGDGLVLHIHRLNPKVPIGVIIGEEEQRDLKETKGHISLCATFVELGT